MSERPKRLQSDLTVPIDRSKLPPVGVSQIRAMDLDPDHPETREMMVRAQEGREEAVTLEPCPACQGCRCCHGARVVTPTRAAAWAAEQTKEGPTS